MNNKRILIIGLGLIGGSYAKRLSSLGYEVFAISDKGSDIDSAKEDGVIVDGYTSVSEEIISSFDRMVFALYPLAFLSWMERYANLLRRGTIITDVTGVKRGIVYEITPRLPAGVEFIASHPMAGKQKSGYEYSSASLFEGRNYLTSSQPPS